MTALLLHPSELAYGFANSRTEEIIGWGKAPFLPKGPDDGDFDAWVDMGAKRLIAAGGMTRTPEEGFTLAEALTEIILALVDPTLVLLVERKAGEGMRRMTVHLANNDAFGMTRRPDGMFEVVRYAELTAAAVASAGYLGAAMSPVEAGTRLESDAATMKDVRNLATGGQTDDALAKLTELGASAEDAASILKAMAEPAASGMLSVLYCANNVALNAQPFSVMTNADRETWILFPQGSLNGPMVLERSSVQALSGRVIVGVAAQLKLAKAS